MRASEFSVLKAFLDISDQEPEKQCLTFEGEIWSYTELRKGAESFAARLAEWGLESGERVALFAANHPDFLAAYLGTHLAGGAVVPVNTAYKQVELSHILEDASVRLCITDAERAEEVLRVRKQIPSLETVIKLGDDFDSFTRPADNVEFSLPDGDDIAMIAYTSGTTGRSKGAMLSHRNLASNVSSICEAWRWTAEDRLLLTLPLFHMHGLWVGAMGTLFAGASLQLRSKFDAKEVYDTLLKGDTTMFFGVPTMYGRLLREARAAEEHPDPLRLYVSGSAPLSPQVSEEFEQLFGQSILERYGMTETGMNLTNPYEGERRPGTVGGPFPRQEARVVDTETREPLGAGEVGEIEVRGPHVFAGYLNRPDATEESFDSEGWFHTGDLGWTSEDGYFTISGRAKELIISGGYNVYPREVEEVLEDYPGISEVAVVGLPDEEYGERVAAAVVVEDESITEEAVILYCQENLAGFKKPREVYFVSELPRNALGKILKHEVRDGLATG